MKNYIISKCDNKNMKKNHVLNGHTNCLEKIIQLLSKLNWMVKKSSLKVLQV